jgi:hypothetical protein
MEPCLMKESFEDYTRVLNEYCRSSRLERKQVIKVLRGQRRRGATGAARGARSTYGSEDIEIPR